MKRLCRPSLQAEDALLHLDPRDLFAGEDFHSDPALFAPFSTSPSLSTTPSSSITFNTRMVCATENFRIFCVPDFDDLKLYELADPEVQGEDLLCMAVIDPRYTMSENMEVLLVVGDRVVAVDDDGTQVLSEEEVAGGDGWVGDVTDGLRGEAEVVEVHANVRHGCELEALFFLDDDGAQVLGEEEVAWRFSWRIPAAQHH